MYVCKREKDVCVIVFMYKYLKEFEYINYCTLVQPIVFLNLFTKQRDFHFY